MVGWRMPRSTKCPVMREKNEGSRGWDAYLDAPLVESKLLQSKCDGAFASQRERIEVLLRKFKPSRVACLGSGFLNDLPIELLFETANETFFIDWLPDVSRLGLRKRIIQQDQDGSRCVFCKCSSPERFCRGFSGTTDGEMAVCSAFSSPDASGDRCESYDPGEEPQFVCADVTSGRASRFGQRVFAAIQRSDSPKQAFNRAIRECRKCSNLCDPIPIDSHAFDFVTSSLVASQFDSEPYNYFAHAIEKKFGREAIQAKADALTPLMEELRSELFRIQIEGHCEEIFRLLDKEHGRAYLSVELFRSIPTEDDYFLVHETPQLLETMKRLFFFDFDSIPAEKVLTINDMGPGKSVVQSFVLRPRKDLIEKAA